MFPQRMTATSVDLSGAQTGGSRPAATRRSDKRWRLMFSITTTDVGGAEHILRELALRLDRERFEPVVCSLCPPGCVGEEIAAAGIEVRTLNMSARPRPLELVTAAVHFGRLLDELRIDLVHSFLYRGNVLARIGARLARRRPLVVSGHHSLSPLGDPRGPLVARWTGRLSDRVVVVSRAVRDEVIRTEGIRPEQVVILENGVDTHYYDVRDSAPARAQLGLDPNAIVVGAVGRLAEGKEFHYLLDSMALARQRGVTLDLLLAGEGPERARLEQQARALGLDRHVRFLGVVRDLRPVYAAIDIFALNSREEASPTVLLEAMACGRAAVATTVGGVLEMVEHERTGILVSPGAPAAFADGLVRLATDADLRHRLGSAARAHVVERFEMARMVANHERFYKELLEARSVP